MALSAPAAADGFYQGKDVDLIVPNAPAGSMAMYARLIAPYLEKHLGAHQVRVDFRKGGGGLIGSNQVAQAKPDGLTVGFGSRATLVLAQLAESAGVQFDAQKLTYLGRVSSDPRLFVVGAKSPLKTIDDVIASKEPFKYASVGTDENFYTMAVLADALGFEMRPVTGYESIADTTVSVLKGDTDGVLYALASVEGGLKSGELRLILTLDEARYPDYPDVPILDEVVGDSGRAAADSIVKIQALHRGFFGPPGMDPVATEDFRKAVEATMNDPEMQAAFAKQNLSLNFMSGAEEQERVQTIFAAASNLTATLKAAVESIK
jgi:tripartite-type tricarboxylate transporter receptor subunit TctC